MNSNFEIVQSLSKMEAPLIENDQQFYKNDTMLNRTPLNILARETKLKAIETS